MEESMTAVAGEPMNGAVSQYLSFSLGEEDYGVDILRVQEIKGYCAITPIPNTPDRIRGVINLRGVVVPVIDLRVRFGMPPAEYTKFTVIVLVAVGQKIAGLIVDAVRDVLDLDMNAIQPPPDLGNTVDMRFVRGIARSGEQLVVLLDVDRLLAEDLALAPAF